MSMLVDCEPPVSPRPKSPTVIYDPRSTKGAFGRLRQPNLTPSRFVSHRLPTGLLILPQTDGRISSNFLWCDFVISKVYCWGISPPFSPSKPILRAVLDILRSMSYIYIYHSYSQIVLIVCEGDNNDLRLLFYSYIMVTSLCLAE